MRTLHKLCQVPAVEPATCSSGGTAWQEGQQRVQWEREGSRGNSRNEEAGGKPHKSDYFNEESRDCRVEGDREVLEEIGEVSERERGGSRVERRER